MMPGQVSIREFCFYTKGNVMNLTLNINETHDTENDLCKTCNSRVYLIIAHGWHVDSEDEDMADEFVELSEEVTAHYCKTCDKITSFAFNS